MRNVRGLLQAERETERQFVIDAVHEAADPTGWPAALLMFHVARWRERLRDALLAARDDRPYKRPPEDIDAFNDRELASAAGVSLHDAATEADQLLAELIGVAATMGDRPFTWYVANTTGEALVRNSYHHPRVHLAQHFIERGEPARAYEIYEDSAGELRRAAAPAHLLGPATYNVACARVGQGRFDDALRLLEDAFSMRQALREHAAADPDLLPLSDDPRFRSLLKG